jgi:hypothetical protein
MASTRTRLAVAAATALALAVPLAIRTADAATQNATAAAASFTPAQVLAGVQANMTAAKKVNTKPHINTMTRSQNVNVYQVASGVYAYTSGMAIDTDGSDPDPDPDHQGETTWEDSNGQALGAHHVPFYVLGDDCWDRTSPCPHFFYRDHNMTGRQFALMFYNGRVIGSIFGDTQTANSQTTSDNDSRELGEASVKAAQLLGIPSSGTTGGVDNGVTVVMFSGSSWVVNGTNANLNDNTQALVQRALDSLGASMGSPTTPPVTTPPVTTPPATGGNKTYEGESATLAGGTTVTQCAHCSGTKKLSFLKQGSSATYSDVTESANGSYTLKLYFMSVGQTNTLTLTVNGTTQSVALPSTKDYNTVVEKDIPVSLHSGSNTIVLSNPGSVSFNVDRIVV